MDKHYVDQDALMEFANNLTVGLDANDIARFPRANVRPAKYGRLVCDIEYLYGDDHTSATSNSIYHDWFCSECGELCEEETDRPSSNYCFNCGAEFNEYAEPTGTWGIEFFADGRHYRCSNCKHRFATRSKFCPDCGTRMVNQKGE